MYKAVIFDFFGVFCTPMGTNWVKKIAPGDIVKMKAFQDLFGQSDLGKITIKDFNTKASFLTGVPVDLIEDEIEKEKVIDTTLVAYTKKLLDKGYRIVCLSNGSHDWTTKVINDEEMHGLFEDIILSSDLGIVKPDIRIYKYCLQKIGMDSSEVLFVDDRETNIIGAESCGIRSILFSDTDKFIKDFESIEKENKQ